MSYSITCGDIFALCSELLYYAVNSYIMQWIIILCSKFLYYAVNYYILVNTQE